MTLRAVFAHAIIFDEWSLEAVSLDLLQAFGKDASFEVGAVASGGGDYFTIGDYFCLEERGLIEGVVAVYVVACNVDGNEVLLFQPVSGKLPLVQAIVSMPCSCRAVAEELSIEVNTVKRGTCDAEKCRIARGFIENDAESDG